MECQQRAVPPAERRSWPSWGQCGLRTESAQREGGTGFQGLYRALGEVGPQGGGSVTSSPFTLPRIVTSLLAFSDLGPKGHSGGRALQVGQEVMFKKKNEVRARSIPASVYVPLWPLGGSLLTGDTGQGIFHFLDTFTEGF